MQTLSILEMQILAAIIENAEDREKHLISWIQASLIFSIVWGVGGILDADSRLKFDAFIKLVKLH